MVKATNPQRRPFTENSMIRKLAIAASLAVSATVAVTAPALADRLCGPSYYYSSRWGECRPYGYYEAPAGVVGSAVNGAGYVAGTAIGAAGNVAGAAVGTAGAIVNSVLPH
jgi:hypothetical protein